MKTIRTFVLALAIAVGGGISPMTAASLSQPPPGVFYEIMYYDSVSYQNLVGHYREYCDSHYAGWGYPTEYSYEQYYEC